ncbi:methylated-DNA--[protein]-cysteine S-methyltransferase [Lawsonibacter sp. LCP25S3_G6]|uniref:methylated-DNA--[protein]-cysteine S-methyltransferase n=1 Tax=unclassified Lawsonibacter TaxID=2617946 RepID=UPI003F9E4ACA
MAGFAIYESPFGPVRMDYEGDVLLRLRTVEPTKERGEPTELTKKVFSQLQEYFSGQRKTFDFPYELRGTEFQKKVWAALETIPYGQTRSYREIAQAVGNPKAVRAVGAANGKNPMWIVVPCHRVVGANGTLTGYAGGIDMKRRLLELEQQVLKRNGESG